MYIIVISYCITASGLLQGDSGGPLVVQAVDDKLEIVGKSNMEILLNENITVPLVQASKKCRTISNKIPRKILLLIQWFTQMGDLMLQTVSYFIYLKQRVT